MNCCTLLLLTFVLALSRHEILAQIGCKRRYMRQINGKCYYFSVSKLNWFGALNNCLRKGLVLAELATPLDFYGVVNFLISMGTQEDFWFAGNDLQTEGRFQYITNARLVRYFSNYSIVDPAEASDCDDCLEVRLRQKLSVVADDNCLERQYFICSERYCDPGQNVKKKQHHSHEHLHHFHHDIDVGDDDNEDYDNINVGSEGGWGKNPDGGTNVGDGDNSEGGVEITTGTGGVTSSGGNEGTPPWGSGGMNSGSGEGINSGGGEGINSGGGEGINSGGGEGINSGGGEGINSGTGAGLNSEEGVVNSTEGGAGKNSEGDVGINSEGSVGYNSEDSVGGDVNPIQETSKPPYSRRTLSNLTLHQPS